MEALDVEQKPTCILHVEPGCDDFELLFKGKACFSQMN